MNKKILVISILAAALMILLPLSSVVGTSVVKSDKENVGSPLFAVRHQSKNTVQSQYLGKGKTISLFIEKKMTYSNTFDRVISMVQRNPDLFNKILEKIQENPKVIDILKENDISITDFESYTNTLKNNPVLLEQEIKKIKQYIPEDTPMQLGLNTTNPFAIIIMVLVFFPLIITIGILIATVTIITCLNINSCFENILQNVFDAFMQGLTQPDA